MWIQKHHAGLIQGANPPKSMLLGSNLEFHRWCWDPRWPYWIIIGKLKSHTGLVRGPNASKSMFLDSNLEFLGWWSDPKWPQWIIDADSKKLCWVSSRPKCAQVYVFGFALWIPGVVTGSEMAPLTHRWGVQEFYAGIAEGPNAPKSMFLDSVPSVVIGFKMTPLNYSWGFKKILLD